MCRVQYLLHIPDINLYLLYSISMQLVGQQSTQTPQSTHSSASTTAISSSFIAIAVAGHSSTHDPQPTHSSALIFATIVICLLNLCCTQMCAHSLCLFRINSFLYLSVSCLSKEAFHNRCIMKYILSEAFVIQV